MNLQKLIKKNVPKDLIYSVLEHENKGTKICFEEYRYENSNETDWRYLTKDDDDYPGLFEILFSSSKYIFCTI